ncbi:uncharacterized protein HGUI_00100 [Hanseniaspora guilliermondii]|uniref:Chromosome segregation in meiosis protein 3 domain-containing protein n=1 Tax=Hanseniaspora guilliermondii TaxID=56406 RepID=A0A1L0AW60_9ASCO|nr:uncharacterized protein HGUI_00100 [Hanseniaspora guilliermondii]
MSNNNVLDVGLDSTPIESDDIVKYTSLTEHVQPINPNKFSDKNLLDGRLGLPSLKNTINKNIGKISKLHKSPENKNQLVYDELVKIYRLWAHDMAPKYKLKDTVKLVNRVGKSSDVKEYRRKCIELDINNRMAEREAKASGNNQVIKYAAKKTLQEKLAEDEALLKSDSLPNNIQGTSEQDVFEDEIAQFEASNSNVDNV